MIAKPFRKRLLSHRARGRIPVAQISATEPELAKQAIDQNRARQDGGACCGRVSQGVVTAVAVRLGLGQALCVESARC